MVDEPETPHYGGPTAAERFVDDLAAYVALGRHGLPRPVELELSAIMGRYPAMSAAKDDDGMLDRVTFLDGSAAKRRLRNGRWVVN